MEELISLAVGLSIGNAVGDVLYGRFISWRPWNEILIRITITTLIIIVGVAIFAQFVNR